MKKLFALLLLVTACSNDAITYAHKLDPSAACMSVRQTTSLDGPSTGGDIAICTSHGVTWICDTAFAPECRVLGEAVTTPAERR